MCYAAQVTADYRKYVHFYGADIDIDEFVRLFWDCRSGSKSKIPKALEAPFLAPQSDAESRIKESITAFSAEQTTKLEQDLFKQRTRLADAECTLLIKTTKAATESKRIATDKIDWIHSKPDDFRRTELKDRDSRIFPGQYAPVICVQRADYDALAPCLTQHLRNSVAVAHQRAALGTRFEQEAGAGAE